MQSKTGATFLDMLVEALQRAGDYNGADQVPPAAILWPDREGQWKPLLGSLRQRLPLLTLGNYDPGTRTGPPYWLRCMIARTLPENPLPADATPVIYLPGVSRRTLRDVGDCPKWLHPLVELQYRGNFFSHRNGRDWTIVGFLQSDAPGLGISIAGDEATRDALQRALLKLADEPVKRLAHAAPLNASFFDGLLHPDLIRRLLLWLNDPAKQRQEWSTEEWESFCQLCIDKYKLDPERDSELIAAERLGQRQDEAWQQVWQRFAEFPEGYPRLPALLERARPVSTFSLLDPSETWPQDNENAEAQLRDALLALGNQSASEARDQLQRLEAKHAARRRWVWARLGRSPLAMVLQQLAALARLSERSLSGTTPSEMVQAYAEWGWQVDATALKALAEVKDPSDVHLVRTVLHVVYRPWLEEAVSAFQARVMEYGYTASAPCSPKAGTCLLFSDGLRFDLGQRLAEALREKGWSAEVQYRLAALPTVTATTKPAISPVANQLRGGEELDVATASGSKVTAGILRNILIEAGYQALGPDELGDPNGRAWTEMGRIDTLTHDYGWEVARHVQDEIDLLAHRIQALLEHGWEEVQVITDHGWLMLPSGLPKIHLPEHLTEVRKGRCARLKPGADSDEFIVAWHWDPHVSIALARGIACYEAGRDTEHGGLSPQECIVPMIRVRRSGETIAAATIETVQWTRMRCRVTLSHAVPGLTVDLRRKVGDPASSLLEEAVPPQPDGTLSLVVQDPDREGEAAFLVVLAADGTVLQQMTTTIGG